MVLIWTLLVADKLPTGCCLGRGMGWTARGLPT